MIPSGYSRTVLIGHLSGGEIFNTGFWTAEAPTSEDAATTQAEAFAAAWNAKVADVGHPESFLGSASGYDTLRVYSYTDTSGTASFIGEAALTNPSTSGVDSLPNQCALVATLLTGRSGRRNRGRMYLPCTKASTTGGQITTALAGNLCAWVADFLGDCATAAGQPVVVLSQVAGTAGNITQVRIDTRVDIQRRRAASESGISSVTNDVANA